jgi:signal transduction histidine kinase
MIIEVRLPLNNRILKTGFNSDSLVAREKVLWRDFTLFALLIGALGVFFSWLLYRYQLSIIIHARRSDRRLAREREDAILGRAAAAVAHEIRNPLNAIDIGLQRLELEESGLQPEYSLLTGAMRNAVSRANSIVGDLRRFAQPLTPQLKTIEITSLIEDIIALYQARAEAARIKISLHANLTPAKKYLQVDPQLMGQALENICKNAIEAQPEGGYLKISLKADRNNCQITFINAGFKLAPQDVKKITEPWFTTKTRGTGLGLALVERIIKAHNGRFEVKYQDPEILQQQLFIPYNA